MRGKDALGSQEVTAAAEESFRPPFLRVLRLNETQPSFECL